MKDTNDMEENEFRDHVVMHINHFIDFKHEVMITMEQLIEVISDEFDNPQLSERLSTVNEEFVKNSNDLVTASKLEMNKIEERYNKIKP